MYVAEALIASVSCGVAVSAALSFVQRLQSKKRSKLPNR